MTDEWRSPSQLNEYSRCPYSYYLSRRKKVWKRPAAWLAHGVAVHKAMEVWEQSGRQMTLDQVLQVFRNEYSAQINEELKATPNPRTWFSSGPYNGSKDIPRRYQVGQDHVRNLMDYYIKYPDQVPDVIEERLGVEYEFDIHFGETRVVGFIDLVMNGMPYDYKTGTTPGGDEQLATYAGVLKKNHDIPFSNGFYFMARTGKPTRPYDLTGWSLERLEDVYGELDQKIKAEEFPPTPGDACRVCPVSTSCEFAQL
jgi:putative RecB family exonuclease